MPRSYRMKWCSVTRFVSAAGDSAATTSTTYGVAKIVSRIVEDAGRVSSLMVVYVARRATL
jgi:hypothetical protein